MSVFPNILQGAGNALYGNYEWRFYDETATHFRYAMWNIANGAFHEAPASAVQVGKSGQPDYNTWTDADPNIHPMDVVDNNTVNVTFNYSNTFYSFVKPIVASWISTGSPINTNSVSNPSVSYVVADNELRIIIPSASVSTEIAGTANANRRTYYQLRKTSGANFFEQIAHTQGWPTNHTIVPPTPGTYLLEKVRDNPLDYYSYNSVEVTQAQLDAWHSANNGHIYYDSSSNYLHYFIHSSEDTTNLLFGSSGRELFYRVRSVNQSVHNFNHLHDYDTNGTYRPTAHGIYHLERVLTNPSEVLSYAYAEVTQSQLDAWNLLNAVDSSNDTPPNTPRGRRGNHNFW